MKKFIRSYKSFCCAQDCFPISKSGNNAKAHAFRPLSTHVKSENKYGTDDSPIFQPCRVAILSRITRYEFEKLRHKGISEEGLKEKVNNFCT